MADGNCGYFCNHGAIVPTIAGWARQHGINTILVDDRDPFAHGFLVLWARRRTPN